MGQTQRDLEREYAARFAMPNLIGELRERLAIATASRDDVTRQRIIRELRRMGADY